FQLVGVEPMPFSESLLTREGLRQLRGPFQDFDERGQLAVFLIVHPGAEERFEPQKEDVLLHFAPLDGEFVAIFDEILGTELRRLRNRALTDAEKRQIQSRFPVFWKISDYYQDSYLSPAEAKLLYQECLTLSDNASSPDALRGLDKLL